MMQVVFTFLHDIFHTHQTTFMHRLHFCTTSSTLMKTTSMQIFTFLHGHVPHSSDHFHASLRFYTTSSTLIRLLPCKPLHFCTTSSTDVMQTTSNASSDIFARHRSTLKVRPLPCTVYIFAPHFPHSSDHFHAAVTFFHDIFHKVIRLLLMYLGTFLHHIFHTHQTTSMHLEHFCMTCSTLIRPLPCSVTFYSTSSTLIRPLLMYLYIFAPHLPHSSDHFHAPLHFCTTSSTLIRPLSCGLITFLHDVFHTHKSTSIVLMSVEHVVQKSYTHQTTFMDSGVMSVHDIFHTQQTTSMVPLHFCTTSSTLSRWNF